jgi:hypothetical protein
MTDRERATRDRGAPRTRLIAGVKRELRIAVGSNGLVVTAFPL